ncbi:MAG TPA: hypothetical protein VMH83_00550, partial [Candidatus Acidoferrum sp.]|nr:hypothetical protein [Candidatus Acidoferrum sp.]
VLGGALIPVLTETLGVAPLMLIAVAGHLGALVALTQVIRATPSSFALAPEGEEGETAQASRRSIRDLLADRYIGLFFAISALSYLGYYFVDFLYYDRVGQTFDDPEKLADFFGVFLGVCGVVNLVSNLFLSGPILGRFGVRIGILLLPAFVLMGTAAMTVTTLAGTAIAVIAACAIATKLVDEVLRKSLEGPIYRILYQPLPPPERLRVQTLRESIVEAGSIGCSGVVLALLTGVLKLPADRLVWILAVILALWLTVAVLLGRAYGGQLMRAVSGRRFGSQETLLRDGASLDAFERFLRSDIADDVIYSLEMIEGIAPDRLLPLLPALLTHAQADVRLHVLALLEKYHPAAMDTPVRALLAVEPDVRVRAMALRALCAMVATDAIDVVLPYADAQDLVLRKGAMVGLLRHGGIDGVLAAGRKLQELLESAGVDDRVLAATIVGEVGIRSFYRPLARLLADADYGVRRAATLAAGHLAEPRLGELLVENLHIAELADTTMSSLVALGDAGLPGLRAALAASRPGVRRRRLLRVLGRLRTPASSAVLLAELDQPELELVTEVLHALVANRHRATADEALLWQQRLRRESAMAARCCGAVRDLVATGGSERLLAALRIEIARGRERALDMLAFIVPQQALLDAKRRLDSNVPAVRATAIELLDTLVPASIKRDVFPLLDDSNRELQESKLLAQFPVTPADVDAWLASLLARDIRMASAWTTACLLEFIANRRGPVPAPLRDAVLARAAETRPVVRETAQWCLHALQSGTRTEEKLPC